MLFLKETVTEKAKLTLKNTIRQYYNLILNSKYITYVLILAIGIGFKQSFNSISPFLLENKFHCSASLYGILLLLVGASYIVGAVMNIILLKFMSNRLNALIGSGLFGFLIVFLANSISIMTIGANMYMLIVPVYLGMFCWGFVFANCITKAMENSGTFAGISSAFMGFVLYTLSSLIGTIIAESNINTVLHISYTYIVIGIACISCFLLAVKKSKATS